MRFGDVQDTRKAEVVKEQRTAAFRKLYDECMEKISGLHGKKVVVAFGATFTV